MSTVAGHPQQAALSRWQPVSQRAVATGLSAAAVILVAACSSGGGGPAATGLTPEQAVLAAASGAQRVTSATETLNIRVSGSRNGSTSGTIQVQLKPTLLLSEDLNVTVAGKSSQIKTIIAGPVVYLNQPTLTSQLGKPWLKISLSALRTLAGPAGAGVAQLIHSLESNTFTNQARLLAVAKNTRVVGKQTVDGVSTTEYAGSFKAAQGLKALPASFHNALAPALQALGNSTISFREWIDGPRHLRKMTEVETVNGDTINITINIMAINQPVHIPLPPTGQTLALQGGSHVHLNPGNSRLGAKIVPAPSGFTLSQSANAHNGPINAAEFNRYMGAGNLASTLHFARGYAAIYNSNSNAASITVLLFQFAAPADATAFKAGWTPGGPVNPKADPVIPGADDYDSTSPYHGVYLHAVIAAKGNWAFVIGQATGSAASIPLLHRMARQQYAAL